jgi:hypothetical protein
MSAPAPNNDTQRELEQRALRNVRGLVDKMEDSDAHDTRTQRRYLIGIVVGGILVTVAFVIALWIISARQHVANTIEPKTANPAPAPR